MKIIQKTIWVLVGQVISLSLALAQENDNFFTVDRPGVADLPYLVKPGQFQFEAGLDYVQRENLRRLQIPVFQFRTGLGAKAELRVSLRHIAQDSLQDEISPYRWSSGITSPVIGIKVPFVKEKGIIPEIALMSNLTIPFIGEKEYRPKSAGHDIYLLFNNNLSQQWSLNYNLGAIWEGIQASAIWTYSCCLSFQPTPSVGFFIEHYAFIPEEESAEWGGDAGITCLLSPKSQVDLSAGISRVQDKNLYFVSAGISCRLDKKKK
ncbi:MAG: transporter [Microscillaceae bacterium]|nr:transporter [Microscillaceae bacterium]